MDAEPGGRTHRSFSAVTRDDPDTGRAWRSQRGTDLACAILGEALDGRPALVRTWREGAAAMLAETAERDLGRTVRTLEIFNDDPRVSLAAALGVQAGLVNLITAPELCDEIVVADLRGRSVSLWTTFAAVVAKTRAEIEGAMASFVLVHDSDIPVPAGCKGFDDAGLVDVLDALVFARDASPWPRGLAAELASAVIVECSRGDLDALAGLATLDLRQAVQPLSFYFAQTPPGEPHLLPWRGGLEPSPTWLAHHHPAQLRRRIWRGQVGVVLPWLEDIRATFLAGSGQRLSAGVRRDRGEEPIDHDAFEFSHIAKALQDAAADRDTIGSSHVLRLARNELAHGRALDHLEILNMEKASAKLLGWTGGPQIIRRPAIRRL